MMCEALGASVVYANERECFSLVQNSSHSLCLSFPRSTNETKLSLSLMLHLSVPVKLLVDSDDPLRSNVVFYLYG